MFKESCHIEYLKACQGESQQKQESNSLTVLISHISSSEQKFIMCNGPVMLHARFHFFFFFKCVLAVMLLSQYSQKSVAPSLQEGTNITLHIAI